MYIKPVFLLRWKRGGARLLKQQANVRNMVVAVCRANCLRMSHKLFESFMVLIIN